MTTRSRAALLGAILLCAATALSPTQAASAHDGVPGDTTLHFFGPAPAKAAAAACTNGSAGGFPCKNVDLLSNVPLAAMGGGNGSGGWGWTDPSTGREYAIAGRSNGTAFVDVTNPTSPVFLGNLPTATGASSWRELNVHDNTAYIVSDFNGAHGLQVFDLTRLRGVTTPQTFTADLRDTSFGRAHTVTINYTSGYLFVNGSDTCAGGPRVYNLAQPKNPALVGCVSADGYTHDSQCVKYTGPDSRYTGKDVCINSNEDTLTLWDMTNKASPTQLSRKGYAGSGYVHQGWFTEDQKYFLLDDELDEENNNHNSYTYVWDMTSLTNPVLLGHYTGRTTATDHNQFIKGTFSYQSNYTAGLSILDLTNVANPAAITEAAYFDVYPESNNVGFDGGTWTNYAYFPSGNVAVFTMDRGLFVLKPTLVGGPQPGANLALNQAAAGSAACSPDEGPAKAVNGSTSGGNSDKFCSSATVKTLQVDLGANRALQKLTVKHAGAGGESTALNTRDFDLEVSTGGEVWTTVAQVRGNTSSSTDHLVSTTARLLRITVVNGAQTSSNVARIYEFQAFA